MLTVCQWLPRGTLPKAVVFAVPPDSREKGQWTTRVFSFDWVLPSPAARAIESTVEPIASGLNLRPVVIDLEASPRLAVATVCSERQSFEQVARAENQGKPTAALPCSTAADSACLRAALPWPVAGDMLQACTSWADSDRTCIACNMVARCMRIAEHWIGPKQRSRCGPFPVCMECASRLAVPQVAYLYCPVCLQLSNLFQRGLREGGTSSRRSSSSHVAFSPQQRELRPPVVGAARGTVHLVGSDDEAHERPAVKRRRLRRKQTQP